LNDSVDDRYGNEMALSTTPGKLTQYNFSLILNYILCLSTRGFYFTFENQVSRWRSISIEVSTTIILHNPPPLSPPTMIQIKIDMPVVTDL